jgi:hypothetical protein
LEGIAKGVKGKVYVCLSYPADEVGNAIMDEDALFNSDINPYTDILSKKQFREKFGVFHHPITGSDHIQMYEETAPNIEVVLLNNPKDILKYTNQVIVSSIHTRHRHKAILQKAGGTVYTLDDICNTPTNQHGWSEYGVLGSNKSKDGNLKLFPRGGQKFVEELQAEFKKRTGVTLECIVYGDGAFKDPVGGIWELADPVVSPAFTSGLLGTPNEIKLKYFSENKFKDLNGKELDEAMREEIKAKDKELKGSMATQGTTPRRYTDLLGSLCDLTSGSGDKGTPVVLVQRYFTNYSNE